MNKKLKNKVYPQYFILPGLLIYLIFVIIPNLTGFYYAFTNWNAMIPTPKFIGLKNFRDIFDASSGMGGVFLNTMYFALSTTIFKLLAGLFLALLLNRKLKTRNALRAIYFLPMTVATIVIGIVFSEILKPQGLVNEILRNLGLGFFAKGWIQDPELAIWSVSGVDIWRGTGFTMAVFLAALQSIPQELGEAARIDGAGSWHVFRYITIPHLFHSIEICVTLGLLGGFKVFDLVYVVTNGGPGHASEVLNVTVFNEFSQGTYGYSTAMGVLLFLLITVLYFALNMIFRKVEGKMQ